MASQSRYVSQKYELPLTIIPIFETPNTHPDPYSTPSLQENPPPPAAAADGASIPSPRSGRHPVYRGIRSRSGKWVSEIREPHKTTRIWLGTYPTPEMAAAAYDVAAMALKGPDATINFPDLASWYPVPASQSSGDIRAAAAEAAAGRATPQLSLGGGNRRYVLKQETETSPIGDAAGKECFLDEEELFDMPKLLEEMAEGMLVSPPRLMSAADDEESPENYSGSVGLWSYS